MARIPTPQIPQPSSFLNNRRITNDCIQLMNLTPSDINIIRGGGDSAYPNNIKVNLGDTVVLPGPEAEDYKFGGTVFTIKGHVREFNGVEINSYILKEVVDEDTPVRRKMTMSREICNLLGIEYEDGLELWPDTMGFLRVSDLDDTKPKPRPLDYGNMGTYPTSIEDNTIRKICIDIELSNQHFSIQGDGTVTTDTGMKYADVGFFASQLRFSLNQQALRGFKVVQIMPITPNHTKDGGFNGHLYFELTILDANGHGILPMFVEGLNIDDIIIVSWDETVRPTPVGIPIKNMADAERLFRQHERMFDRQMTHLIGLQQVYE